MFRKSIITLTLLAAFISTQSALAVATSQPPLGTFQIRPELAGQHPRLFFTAADIPTLQTKAQTTHKWWIDRARAAHGNRGSIPTNLTQSDWEGYLHLWAGSTQAILYRLEGNTTYRDRCKTWAMQLVNNQWWIVDDLIPMDSMSGLAIYYDLLYDEFTPTERQQIRAALYAGIQHIAGQFFVDDYWTNDYQNNHIFNRLHALALASFAIYGDDPAYNTQQYADLAIEGVNNLILWLPEDGSTHEGPGYWTFGYHWAERVITLAEHVTGTDYFSQNTHFQNAPYYKIYTRTPGWSDNFGIGDTGGSSLGSSTVLSSGISQSQNPMLRDVLDTFKASYSSEFYQHPIWGLFWDEPTQPTEPYQNLPLYHFWPDLEMFTIRASWDDDALGIVFKCGPVGGHKLNQLRGNNYANVAHDHPDQNHFAIYYDGKMLATDDGYPKDMKLAASHNTITVSGEGQPREGGPWSQPFDYNLHGRMDDLFLTHNTAYAAGNASTLYSNAKKFIRHIAFVRGEYILIIDELEGAISAPNYQWRLHSNGIFSEPDPAHFTVTDRSVGLDIDFLFPQPADLTSQFLPSQTQTSDPCVAVDYVTSYAPTKLISLMTPYPATGQTNITGQNITTAANAWAAETTGPDFTDFYAVNQTSGSMTFGPIISDGQSAMARFISTNLDSAVLTRGTELRAYGSLIIGASVNVNISLRRDGANAIIEVDAPYKTTGGPTVVNIGQLPPNQPVPVSLNGVPYSAPVADSTGVIQVLANLSERAVFTLPMGGNSFTAVLARHTFYNNSAFDNNDTAPNENDDNAIATDKQPLLPGQTATFANYTSYDKGINGIIIDVNELAGTPTAADFVFQIGNSSLPNGWAAAPTPSSITVRTGQGVDATDRVTIIWPDYVIRKNWLRVKMLATANTGLAIDDDFYFGNALGDTGDQTANSYVDAADEIGCRNNSRHFLNPATIDFPYDHNRDGKVNASDEIISRNNPTTMLNSLRLLAAP